MIDTFEALSAILSTGANGVLCIIGYAVLKHELRITRLEAKS